MSLTLSQLKPANKSRTRRTRIGRGNGSGIGTYSGKGLKGQRARSGGRAGLRLMALKRTFMKLPKFKGQKPIESPAVVLKIATVNALSAAGVTSISKQTLIKMGMIPAKTRSLKILGKGNFTHPVTIRGISLSKSAQEALEKAGGSAPQLKKRNQNNI